MSYLEILTVAQVWASAADGRAGWVPEGWLQVEGKSGVLLRDYTAAELPLEPGDMVSGELIESGWLWAIDAGGRAAAVERHHDVELGQEMLQHDGHPGLAAERQSIHVRAPDAGYFRP